MLLVVAIGLITLDYRGFGPVGSLRGASAGFFGPVERVTAEVTRPVTGFFEAVVGAPAAHSKIQALEQENLRLRAELNTAQLSKADAAQLSRLLQVAGRGGYRLVAAHVIGIGVGYEDTVTIDAGTRDGIRADQTVLNDAGLVGRVIQAGPDTSTVLLATDASSAVGCRLEGSQEIGVVRGTGKSLSAQGGLRMELLDANAVLQPGQRIVTLGSVGGHPYVPGVPIGVITRGGIDAGCADPHGDRAPVRTVHGAGYRRRRGGAPRATTRATPSCRPPRRARRSRSARSGLACVRRPRPPGHAGVIRGHTGARLGPRGPAPCRERLTPNPAATHAGSRCRRGIAWRGYSPTVRWW